MFISPFLLSRAVSYSSVKGSEIFRRKLLPNIYNKKCLYLFTHTQMDTHAYIHTDTTRDLPSFSKLSHESDIKVWNLLVVNNSWNKPWIRYHNIKLTSCKNSWNKLNFKEFFPLLFLVLGIRDELNEWSWELWSQGTGRENQVLLIEFIPSGSEFWRDVLFPPS